MKRVNHTIVFICLLCSAYSLSAQGIEFFHGDFAEALEEAKKQEKPIFVDAYTTWCGPCKMMAKNVFTNQQVGDFFNANFVSVKIDMEQADGLSFQKTYPVTAYPTLYFIGSDGKVLKRIIGAKGTDAFINEAKSVLGKSENLEQMAKIYEKGNREPAFMYKYIRAMNMANKSNPKVVNEYLRSQTKLTDDWNRKIVLEAATNQSDTKAFELLTADREGISKLMGKEKVDNVILYACRNTAKKAVNMKSEDLLKATKKQMQTLLPERAKAFAARCDLDQASNEENDKAYVSAANAYAKAGETETPADLRDVAFNLKEMSEKGVKGALDAALACIKVAAEKSKQSIYTLSYADLLLLKGDKNQAKTMAEKAMKLAEAEGDDAQLRVKSFMMKLS
jgi:thiol-disulfide isomerase/thioredoxin